jgi:uncharacterized protein (DUF58 family)
MLSALQRLSNQLKQRWKALFRVAKSVDNVATLNARQIYILPTRWSIFYILMLIALLIGAINYTLSLAYFVTFLLAALANVAMLHTWRNLAYLEVSVNNAQAIFAGDIAEVNIKVRDLKNRARHAIYANFINNAATAQSINANGSQAFTIPLTTHQRGYLALPRLRIYTEFPLSLFHAWAVIDSDYQVLVYPKPAGDPLSIPSGIDPDTAGNHAALLGDEDFIGHKTYQVGDLPSKVDWKASSKGIGMFSKQYTGDASKNFYLDWLQTAGDTETRISQLTRWVIDAHSAQLKYGLMLDNQVQLPPDNSTHHYHACLKALATR